MNDKYFSRNNLELVVEGLKFGIKENLDPIIDDLKQRAILSDWNQNDPEAKDYIKNRTHYEVPEVYIPLDIINDDTILYDWNKDESYLLRVDGVTYSFDSMTKGGYHSPSGQYIWYLGSRTVVGINDTFVDTWDYPFSIYCVENMIADGYMNVWFEDGTSNHTIERIIKEKEIHYLDPKYIKDMYYDTEKLTLLREQDSFNCSTEVNSSELDNFIGLKFNPDIIYYKYAQYGYWITPWDELIGKTVRVVFDGTPYNIFVDDGYRIGNLIDYPFFIYNDTMTDRVRFYVEEPGVHTFELILIEGEIKQIDPKYIPDSILVNPDWNQNDTSALDFIKNKPDVVLRSEIEEQDAFILVVETGLISPIAAEDGSIYTDENGALYSL
jgi:hypothetical protein